MTGQTGHSDRDTILLVADIVPEGGMSAQRYKVRNLSAGGLMAQGDTPLATGSRVGITLRNIGKVVGRVAWAEGDRYGISFDQEIDPQAVRAPVALADFLSDTVRLRSGTRG